MDRNPQIDTVFLSPPWGGTGYNLLKEYTLEHIYPDFNQIVEKALQFSKNLMLFLPRNTSIDDLISRLLPFASRLVSGTDEKRNELVLEIEQLIYGGSCKAILVYIGEIANVNSKEMAFHFFEKYCS